MRVLITRPEPVASKTAAIIDAMGHESVVAPLTRIEPLAWSFERIEEPTTLLASSQNAFLKTPEAERAAWPRIFRFLCVGERTARAALDVGLKDPAIVAPDAAALLSRFDHAGLERSVSTVVYLAGRRREAVLENGFAERNINVTTIETYDAPLVENPFGALDNEAIDAVFLMSRRAARAFGKAWSGKHAPHAICISEHVADALPADYGGERITARAKTLDAMVRALD